jgi:hypothetical protein
MPRVYCTFFDCRYLAKGLAMIASLKRVEPGAVVWVLCLDDNAHAAISSLDQPGLHAMRLAELEARDPELAAAKQDGRKPVEYYFTLKPALIRALMQMEPKAQIFTYLDADLWFTASLEPLFDEMADASVLLTPHRFTDKRPDAEKYGLYNAGWVSFRRDEPGMACLEWWRQRVHEWCGDVVDERHDRFADQRYLNRFANLFPRVRIAHNLGANVAPWNAAHSDFTWQDGKLLVDGKFALLFFHFHGVEPLAPRLFRTAHGLYGARLSASAKRNLYRPYLREVTAFARRMAPWMGASQDLRQASWGSMRLRARLSRILKGLLEGSLVYAR